MGVTPSLSPLVRRELLSSPVSVRRADVAMIPLRLLFDSFENLGVSWMRYDSKAADFRFSDKVVCLK